MALYCGVFKWKYIFELYLTNILTYNFYFFIKRFPKMPIADKLLELSTIFIFVNPMQKLGNLIHFNLSFVSLFSDETAQTHLWYCRKLNSLQPAGKERQEDTIFKTIYKISVFENSKYHFFLKKITYFYFVLRRKNK